MMEWYDQTHVWPQVNDGKCKVGDTFSGCCGSVYGGKPRKIPYQPSKKGLALYTNTLIPESTTPEEVVQHVKTRNGTLTIAAGLIK
jgi:hypothetical protein